MHQIPLNRVLFFTFNMGVLTAQSQFPSFFYCMSKKKMLKIKEVFNTVTICRTLYFVVLIIPVLTKTSLNQFLSFPPAIPVENSVYCFVVLHHMYNRMYFTLNHVCQDCTLLYLYNSLQCWNKIQYYRVSLSILYTMYIYIFILFYPK